MKQQVFKVWKSKKTRRWYWHLVAANGRTVCAGQPRGYKSKRGALKGIEAVKNGALGARTLVLEQGK